MMLDDLGELLDDLTDGGRPDVPGGDHGFNGTRNRSRTDLQVPTENARLGVGDDVVITSRLNKPHVSDGVTEWHAPVIDLDYRAYLQPSSTSEHFHLFIDKALTWSEYSALLDGFRAAGLISEAWYQGAMNNRASWVAERKKTVDYGWTS